MAACVAFRKVCNVAAKAARRAGSFRISSTDCASAGDSAGGVVTCADGGGGGLLRVGLCADAGADPSSVSTSSKAARRCRMGRRHH